MEKAERAKALRDRFKATGGLPYVNSGRVRRGYVVLPKPTGRGFVSLGPALNGEPLLWVKAPDAKPKVAPRTKRNAGAPMLIKIAAKAPKKLVRAYRNKEAMLGVTRV
jgi:hypothetical protein